MNRISASFATPPTELPRTPIAFGATDMKILSEIGTRRVAYASFSIGVRTKTGMRRVVLV